MKPTDLFAEALWKLYETGHATLRFEREDGYRDTEDLDWYLTNYADFPNYEKRALKFARGRVLDIGCGAGRHALVLQRRSLKVTAVDTSPRVIELARTRGVKDARVADACAKLPFRAGEFDTVILFGNNLAICGTPAKFRRMLRELYRVTSRRACILGTTRMPNMTDPVHRRYLTKNVKRGRAVGQIRLRLELEGRRGPWFDLLLLSPTDLLQLAGKEGWQLAHVFAPEGFEQGYSVVMEKSTLFQHPQHEENR
jgi:SAM-dependent methyltransferase